MAYSTSIYKLADNIINKSLTFSLLINLKLTN